MNEVIEKALGLQMNGFHNEALKIFQKALKKEPTHQSLCEHYGTSLLSLGYYKEAKKYLTRALSRNIEKPQVLNNLSTANRALGLFDEGLLNAQSAIKFKPNYVDAWINRANIHMDLNQWSEAISAYKNGINLDKDDKGPYLSLARAYLYNHEYDKSLKLYKKYYPRFKDVEFLIGELICYRAKKDYVSAINFAQKLKDKFDNELMWFEWVQTLWMANELQQVKEESQKAIEKFGKYPAMMSIVDLLKDK